jgi:hypothetical protein
VDVKVVDLGGTGRAEFLGDGAIAVVPPGAEVLPGFAERCAQALAAAPNAAYATTWAAADEPWRARPLGNAVPLVESEDCGGAVLAVRPEHAERALARVGAWELAGGGAWLLARELRAEGAYGVVVPEELVRVRDATDPAARRTEVEAALARERTRWLARHAAVGGP